MKFSSTYDIHVKGLTGRAKGLSENMTMYEVGYRNAPTPEN